MLQSHSHIHTPYCNHIHSIVHTRSCNHVHSLVRTSCCNHMHIHIRTPCCNRAYSPKCSVWIMLYAIAIRCVDWTSIGNTNFARPQQPGCGCSTGCGCRCIIMRAGSWEHCNVRKIEQDFTGSSFILPDQIMDVLLRGHGVDPWSSRLKVRILNR